jgi:4-hydroxybenzoyl-CoA thioesterase
MSYFAEFDVRFGDIDQAHVVYYPRFFHYFHQAFEQWFGAELGVTYPELVIDHGLGLPSVKVETDFRRPLRYGDRFRIGIKLEDIGKKSITLQYSLFRNDEDVPAATARIKTVVIDGEFKSIAIPQWLRERLEAFQKKSAG